MYLSGPLVVATVLLSFLLSACAGLPPANSGAPSVTALTFASPSPSAIQSVSASRGSVDPQGSPNSAVSAEPSEFVPPSPVCPSPLKKVVVPQVMASIGAGAAIIARPYTSTFTTCTTTAVADGVPSLPAHGVAAHPGDALRLVLPSGWRFLRWEEGDGPVVGDAGNVDAPMDTPKRPQIIDVPVPGRSGDSKVGLTLWVISLDGRIVGSEELLFRINVR
jgi:hypothetical protein